MNNKMPQWMHQHDIDDLTFADGDNYPDALGTEPPPDEAATRPLYACTCQVCGDQCERKAFYESALCDACAAGRHTL